MASVFLAEDPVLRRAVAVKVLRGELGTQPDWVRRFRDEATAIARLGSPHVVAVHDFGREAAEDYLVMEFVEGISLTGLLAQKAGRLDPVVAAAAACQVAEGLRAAHALGIIHRDVKPDNILVRKDGTAKVADFGIARLLEEVSRTMTGSVFGSPLYMAPEQVEGRNPSGAIDVFALAGVLFRCLAGRHPFEAEHAHAVMWRIVQEEAPRVSSVLPDVPPEIDELVAAMHMRDPSGRPRASEVVRRLRQFLSSHGCADPVEAVEAVLPDSVVRAEPVLVAPRPADPEPVARPRRSEFLRRHPRLLPLAASGSALVLAAFLAGKAWDRIQLDSIPEASVVAEPASERTRTIRDSSETPLAQEPVGDRSSAGHPPRESGPSTPPKPTPQAPVAEPGSGGSVVVAMRDEAPGDLGAVRPRISLTNRGDGTLSWIRISWPLPVPAGAAPVVDVYYAPKCAARLDGSGASARLVVECSDLSLGRGEIWPGADGMSLSVHHSDWSPWVGKGATGLTGRMQPRGDVEVRVR
jgi:serine/threonine-protein kinase